MLLLHLPARLTRAFDRFRIWLDHHAAVHVRVLPTPARRLAYADERTALQQEVPRQEIRAVPSDPPTPQNRRGLAELLLALAA